MGDVYEVILVHADGKEEWVPCLDAKELDDGRLAAEVLLGNVIFRKPGRWRKVPAKEARARRDEHIRPEIRALVTRGDVTPEEFRGFGFSLNGFEKRALIAALSDEPFLSEAPDYDALGYNEAFEGTWGPESLKRFRQTHRDLRSLTETLIGVHDALGLTTMRCRAATDDDGQITTRHPFIAADIRALVEAIESRCDALVVLKRIRGK